MITKVLFFIYILYCLEVGVFLLVYPWMRLWDQNFLLQYSSYLRVVFMNDFFRGAVSGLGIANLILGAWELAHFQRYFKKA